MSAEIIKALGQVAGIGAWVYERSDTPDVPSVRTSGENSPAVVDTDGNVNIKIDRGHPFRHRRL